MDNIAVQQPNMEVIFNIQQPYSIITYMQIKDIQQYYYSNTSSFPQLQTLHRFGGYLIELNIWGSAHQESSICNLQTTHTYCGVQGI